MPDSALLIMDVQNSVVERFADSAPSLLEALGQAAAAARTSRIPVVYVRGAFRAGAPEVNRNNRTFASLADSSNFVANGPATQIHPAVEPQPGDIVVDKKRVRLRRERSRHDCAGPTPADPRPFRDSHERGRPLDTAAGRRPGLRARRAARRLCRRRREVHRVLLDKVFPRQAGVLTVDEWVAGMGQ